MARRRRPVRRMLRPARWPRSRQSPAHMHTLPGRRIRLMMSSTAKLSLKRIFALAVVIAAEYCAAGIHEQGGNNHGDQVEFYLRAAGSMGILPDIIVEAGGGHAMHLRAAG